MSVVLQERPLTAEQRLEMAQLAWTRAQAALRTMQRLNRYAGKSPAMKREYGQAAGIYNHNTQLHEQIMRGQL